MKPQIIKNTWSNLSSFLKLTHPHGNYRYTNDLPEQASHKYNLEGMITKLEATAFFKDFAENPQEFFQVKEYFEKISPEQKLNHFIEITISTQETGLQCHKHIAQFSSRGYELLKFKPRWEMIKCVYIFRITFQKTLPPLKPTDI